MTDARSRDAEQCAEAEVEERLTLLRAQLRAAEKERKLVQLRATVLSLNK